MTGPLNTRRHPSAEPVADPESDPRLDEGIRLFNEGHRWHAHEAWEPLWMGLDGEDKLFLQGLIMAAAMLHQYGRGVPGGVASHWENVRQRIPPTLRERWGVDAAALLRDLAPYAEDAAAGRPLARDPKAVRIKRR
ncbi:MAG TPA: DUF309 domain-containing protein [Candidatus Thermoplasmatota archaeon]|nr:DUF309 domain-containing protein [Candidatus Thermoplasmatota archaeon]